MDSCHSLFNSPAKTVFALSIVCVCVCVCIDLTPFRSIFCRNAYLSGFQVVSDLKVSGILRMYLFSPMVEFFNETFSNLSYLARRSNRRN